MMTDQELAELMDKVCKNGEPVFSMFNRTNPDWKKLFDFYNELQVKIGGRSMGMGCMPCYAKVYQFIKQYLKNVQSKSGGGSNTQTV